VRGRAARLRWQLQRFGLTPPKLVARACNRAEPRVLCLTLPKAGTHLLERVLCLHPRLYRKLVPTITERTVRRQGGLPRLLARLRPGQVILAHLPHNQQRARVVARSGVRVILLIRDPRDVVVSAAYYLSSRRDHPLHERFASVGDMASRIRLAITGTPPVGSIADTVASMERWIAEGYPVVRFEDLVGPAGGGTEQRQMGALAAVADALGLPMDARWVDAVRRRAFSQASTTFRRGAIGEWRRHFDGETAALFKEVAGEALVRLGYERSLAW
jgi:hypothetical protein